MIKIIKVILVVIWLYIPGTILAKNLGITVDQTAVVFDMDIGEKQEFVVGVKNISRDGRDIFISSIDYQLGDNNIVQLSDDNEATGIKNWVNAEDEELRLAPEEFKKVKFKVDIPEDVAIGSHHGIVVFRVNSEQKELVKVNGQVGVHVLINVKGDTRADGQLNYLKVPFLSKGVVEYSAEFENTGNIHYVPYGEIVVWNPITNFKDKYKYDKHFTFPGKKFTFVHREEIPSIFGLYRVRVTFVSGEGVEYSRFGFVVGYLFPVICIGVIVVSLFMLRHIFGGRKKRAGRNIEKQKKGGWKDNSSSKDKSKKSSKKR